MFTHRFAAGDRVDFVPGSLDHNVRPGTYTVICAVPDAGHGYQYRVKHRQDEHERIIDEAQLRHAKLA